MHPTTSSGRSSVWLERYLGVVEAARSSRVAPTSYFIVNVNIFPTKKPLFAEWFFIYRDATNKLAAT
jgi:hypothetical protein